MSSPRTSWVVIFVRLRLTSPVASKCYEDWATTVTLLLREGTDRRKLPWWNEVNMQEVCSKQHKLATFDVTNTRRMWCADCKCYNCGVETTYPNSKHVEMGIWWYHGTGSLQGCPPEPAAFHLINHNKDTDDESFLRNLIVQTYLITTLRWCTCKSSMHKGMPERGLRSSFSLWSSLLFVSSRPWCLLVFVNLVGPSHSLWAGCNSEGTKRQ